MSPGVSGLGAALPSADYYGRDGRHSASGAGRQHRHWLSLRFKRGGIHSAEVLVSYLAAPRKTRAFMAALYRGCGSRPPRRAALLVAAGGCLMLTLGLSNLWRRRGLPNAELSHEMSRRSDWCCDRKTITCLLLLLVCVGRPPYRRYTKGTL